MKWEGNRESDNVEDRRGSGGGFPIPGGRGIGIGTIVIALLGGWLLGFNQLALLGLLSGGGVPPAQVQQAPAQRPPADDRLARFVSTVLADTEDVWHGVFRQAGGSYQEPRLVQIGTVGGLFAACHCPPERDILDNDVPTAALDLSEMPQE